MFSCESCYSTYAKGGDCVECGQSLRAVTAEDMHSAVVYRLQLLADEGRLRVTRWDDQHCVQIRNEDGQMIGEARGNLYGQDAIMACMIKDMREKERVGELVKISLFLNEIPSGLGNVWAFDQEEYFSGEKRPINFPIYIREEHVYDQFNGEIDHAPQEKYHAILHEAME